MNKQPGQSGPTWHQFLRARLAPLRLSPPREREIVAELAEHLEAAFDEARARGASDAEARQQALQQFADWPLLESELARSEGNLRTRFSQEVETMNDQLLQPTAPHSLRAMLAAFWQDARFGVRLLRQRPGFACVVILTLALGISANTAIFSVLNEALLRPLPVTAPERLVGLYRKVPQDENYNRFSYPNFVDTRERSQSFAGLAAYYFTPFSLSTNGQTERTWGKIVTANYFSVLGVPLALGRDFLPAEDQTPGTHPVVILSYGLWQRRFGADPSCLGQTMTLNGHPFTIIGIAAAHFRGTELGQAPELYVPTMMQRAAMNSDDWLSGRALGWLRVVGRLRDGVSPAQAQAELTAIGAQLKQEYPKVNEAFGIAVVAEFGLHPNFRGNAQMVLFLLLTVVGIVLLIACANIAGLLLARAAERRREIGIRLALGAPRGRLVRQLLTESLLLALAGGLVGALLTPLLLKGLEALLQTGQVLPTALTFQLDQRVLLFTLVLSLCTGLLFGLVPALQAARTNMLGSLRDEGQGTHRLRLRNVFVVVQIALSLLLLVGAGLFLRSLQQAQQIDPGFATRNLLMLSLDLGLQGYNAAQVQTFQAQLQQRLAALPEVQEVTLANQAPLTSDNDTTIEIAGYQPPSGMKGVVINFSVVAENYFATLGLPLVQGRAFAAADMPSDAPLVAIVNETAARRFWTTPDVIGKRLTMGKTVLEIVGIARDSKYVTLGEAPRPYLYLPVSYDRLSALTVLIRTAAEPLPTANAVRQVVTTLDPHLPIYDLRTMTDHLSGALVGARLTALLLNLFGAVALLLAALGLYGVMTYAVSQRTREIGVRMALGATPRTVLRLMIGQGLKLTLWGLLPGLLAALALTPVLESQLYGVRATDAVTFVATVGVLLLVALLACWIPARRATKVDPMIALRQD